MASGLRVRAEMIVVSCEYAFERRCSALSQYKFCVCRYWYKNGCLYPDMGTVFIAIDKCDRENGCLKVCEENSDLKKRL